MVRVMNRCLSDLMVPYATQPLLCAYATGDDVLSLLPPPFSMLSRSLPISIWLLNER
jgi:hypothetical protein